MNETWLSRVVCRLRPRYALTQRFDSGLASESTRAHNKAHGRYAFLVFVALAAFAFGLGTGSAMAATEIEPNNTCPTAQDMGAAPTGVPLTLNAGLASTTDVDFFKVTGTPGNLLHVTFSGSSNGHDTLASPLLAAFGSNCFQIIGGYFQSDPLDAFVVVPPDGIAVFAVTSYPDYTFGGFGQSSGTYTASVAEVPPVASISGRVVDAVTNQPLSGMQLSLVLCADPTCTFNSVVQYLYTDANGRYSLSSSASVGFAISPGSYKVIVNGGFGRYLSAETPVFTASSGSNVVVPDVPLPPVPTIAAIKGRLIDAATRKPLSGVASPYAHVSISGCGFAGCSFADTFADSGGRFVISQDSAGQGIVAGIFYNLQISGDQYVGLSETIATHTAGETIDLGDILVASNPVRFAVVNGCNTVPIIGGSCSYTVTVTNGADIPITGAGWMTVNGSNLNSFISSTDFQVGGSKFSLAPATKTTRTSKTLTFQFYVPGDLPLFATICPTFWFGADPTNNYLGTVGRLQDSALCLARGTTGFAPVSPAQATALRKEARSSEARKHAIGQERK